MSDKLNMIGQSVPRKDGLIPGMLYGKVLRSPYPNARILKIDTTEAQKIPGVRGVITAKDTPGVLFSFMGRADKLALCEDKVRYVGDEIAAVAADTPEIAEEAVRKIIVEYKKLPTVYDPEEAMKPEALLLHEETGSNIVFETHKNFGDVDKAFKNADYIFENRYDTSKVAHCCLETRGTIALYEGGEVTVWSPTQAPHTLRKELSLILNIPIGKVRVIRTMAGGAFGSRLVLDAKEPIAVWLAQKTKRPVKIVNTREEEFVTAKHRYPYIIYLKTGVTKEGKIIARHTRVIVDNGAYNDKGPATLNFSGVFHSVIHSVPNLKFDAYIVYTNKGMGTAFRGFGNPQLHYALETQMDIIAKKLKIDPVELRLKNVNKPGEVASSGARISSCGLQECITTAAKKFNWREKKNSIAISNSIKSNKRKGIGMAVMVHSGSGSRHYKYNSTDCFIKISEDGTVSVITPIPEIGQGSTTIIAQIVAEVLNISTDDIHIVSDDTNVIPFDLGVFGSRGTFVSGNAAKAAA